MMNWHISFLPFFGTTTFAIIAIIAAALALLVTYHLRRGWYLRVASLALTVLALANPIISNEQRQALTDIAAVIIDDSDSQNIGDRRKQSEKALADLQANIKTLGNTELRIAHTVTGTTAETDGTRIFSTLTQTVENIPADRYAGAIIITDGQIHDVPAKLPPSLASAPIQGLLTGSKTESDRRVVIDEAPRFAITGQTQTIAFHIEDKPNGTGDVKITLRMPDGTTQDTTIAANTPQHLDVPIAHAGQNLLQIEAEPRPGEITTANNSALIDIKGIRDRLRVLLVSGEPHPGERTWRNLLKSDAAVDLVHFTILRPPEKQDGTLTKELSLIAFPTRELFIDKIKSFDLVIFDRYRSQSILPDEYLANVADYVRGGGAVLIASGPDLAAPDGLYATSLSPIMVAAPTGNVSEQPFKPAVTKDGLRHPVSRDLPGSNAGGEPTWGHWFRMIDAEALPDTHTLMSGPDGKPLLVLGRMGEGRVAQFLSDQGWLWARGYDGGGPQIELLRRLAHWLMKEPDLEEEQLKLHQEKGNVLVERLSLADTAQAISLTGPDGKAVVVQMKPNGEGKFVGLAPLTQPGLYSATDGTFTTLAALGRTDQKEFDDLRATPEKLLPAATASRGGVQWLEDGFPRISKARSSSLMAGSGWFALKDNQQFRVTAISEISLFATLLSLAALLLAAVAMWFREGR
jgi:hypothetical protein